MTEQDLHDYNKWLMEVWNPNQLYIPFAIDAPRAYLDYKTKQCTIADVGRSTLDLKTIAHLIASKANMPYCWEDILYRLREGLPMPFKLKDN